MELGLLAGTVAEWKRAEQERAESEHRAVESNAIAVAVPVNDMIPQVQRRLAEAQIRSVKIGGDGPPEDPEALHVGTLHRFKCLEYRHVALAGACDGFIPREEARELRGSDPQRHARELQRARSPLFVATTRARDSLAITWHGTPSPFLPPR